MTTSAEFQALLLDLWGDLHSATILWQAGVLAICIGIGWALTNSYNRRTAGRQPADVAHALGIGGIRRLLFPVSTLILVLIAKAILRHWQSTHLLSVAAVLLLPLALIRLAIYVLRHTFAPSPWLRASERWISWLSWIGAAIYLAGLWPHIRDALEDLEFTIGKEHFTVFLVLQGALYVGLALLFALWLGHVAEARLMRATSLQINLRVMFAKLFQISLLLAVVLVALPAAGIDLTVLSVFGGMIGVGIGFGLQKIAANYISGFIILMDRSVSLGDLVTIETHTGILTKMSARYVVLRTLGGLEAIIPNESIIASTVLNHSFTDRKVRVGIPIQVAYATDLDAARAIMVDAAQSHKRVLKDPEPGALIIGFADSGVDLELGIWVDDPDQGLLGLRSDLYAVIWRTFKERGIEIPFPQREVRVLGAVKTTLENL